MRLFHQSEITLRALLIVFIALMLVSSAAAEEKEKLKIGEPVPKFVLKDADDKEYNLENLLGKDKEQTKVKVIILIMGDRSAQKQGDEWAIELDKIYGKKEEVLVLMVADLRGLPFFVTESMVKWGVKREKIPATILLDWEGKVSQLYKTEKGKPDLFVVDKEGKLKCHEVGKYSEELMEKIQKAMPTPSK